MPACRATNITTNPGMNRYLSLLIFIVSINAISAQESTGLSDEDRLLINKTTNDYNICIQQGALRQLDNFADIRQLAAHAVESCEAHFDQFKEKLGDKISTDFYSGLERSIKNRSIRQLLPLLMYEKSLRQDAEINN
jgi:hypothetical protein